MASTILATAFCALAWEGLLEQDICVYAICLRLKHDLTKGVCMKNAFGEEDDSDQFIVTETELNTFEEETNGEINQFVDPEYARDNAKEAFGTMLHAFRKLLRKKMENSECDPVKGEQFVSMAQARMVCQARKLRVDELKAENEDLKKIIKELEEKLSECHTHTTQSE